MWHSHENAAPVRREPTAGFTVWSAAARAGGSGSAAAAPGLAARVEALRGIDLLGDCTDAERLRLAGASTLRRAARGRTLVDAGGDHGCVLLVRGLAKTSVSRAGMDGELVLDVTGPGGLVDEACLSPLSRVRVGAAVAVTECSVLSVARRTLREVLLANARFAARVVEELAARHVRAEALAVQNATLDIAERLYCRVVELAVLRGRRTRAGIVVEHGLTQGELAAFANASRENTNRRLSEWRRAGWIEAGRRSLVVVDAEALGASVGADARRVGFGSGDGRLPLRRQAGPDREG